MSRWGHLSVNNSPNLLSDVLGELSRVSNDDNTTLEVDKSLGESTKGITIQVVSWLIENDQVRTLPRAGGEDDLDTLSSGETQHAGVRNKLSIETEVGAVLLDLLTDQRTELSGGEGLLLIDLSNHLLMGRENLGTWDPGVVSGHHWNPALVLEANVLSESEGTLVLVGVLELAAGVDADNATLGTLDTVDLVHGVLILIGDNLVGTIHGLTILTSLESPLDVLRWGLLEVVIDVGESVLLNVGDTDILVGVNISGGWDKLTGQDVDQGGLSGSVRTDNGNTGSEGTLEGDIGNLWLWSTLVLEGHLGDTDNGLGLGLDTLKETWLWELELHLGVGDIVVGLGGWALLDKLVKVSTIALKLEALVVDDVLADVVDEVGVVGNDDGGTWGVLEVILEPLNVLDIQVVSWLIQQQNIWVLEDGTAKSQLHLPSSGEGGDKTADHEIVEAELVETLKNLLLGGLNTDLSQLLHGPVNGGPLSIGGVKVVLDEDSLDFGLLWETLDLLVVDGAHKGGLSGSVWSKKTVTLATLQAEMGLVKENLGTVGQVEGAVAKILTLLIVSLLSISLSGIWGSALAEIINDDFSRLITDKSGDVGLEGNEPGVDIGILLVNQLTSKGSDILNGWGEVLNDVLVVGLKGSLEVAENGLDVAGVGWLWNLAIGTNGTDTLEGVKSLLGLLTGLRISQVLVVLDNSWHQLWQESGDDVWILDQLTHVVDNDGGFTLDGGLALTKTTLQKWNHDGQGWLVDVSDESGGTEQVNGLWDTVWLGDTLDELWNETLNILVDNETADLLHGSVCHLLDLWLGIPHRLRNDWDQIWDADSKLGWRGLDEGLDASKSGLLLLPFLGSEDRLDDWWEDSLDTVGIDALDDGNGGGLGSIADWDNLVTRGTENLWQDNDEVWLESWGDLGVLGDGLNGVQGALAGSGILLVGEILGDLLKSPVVLWLAYVRAKSM